MTSRRLFQALSLGIMAWASLVQVTFADPPAPQPPCGIDPNDPLALDCAAASGLVATDPRLIAARIINVILGVLGTVATLLIFYAGFLWMTAAGNEDQVTKAKSIMFSAVVGLVIILSAFGISTFIVRYIYEASSGAGYGSGPVIP
ncbi:MAG: hypothetical protein UY92_C0004G0059 [Candidatus Magasanikbacteria bacterium GW2011_GWA2_56_11]|uniref:Uncharacterized protein n=1 Tax=Candidatus Magasanikbacteria bacterium GW2011_GWA2_56_11 TaxID=1619044 RepID=A0A0G1YH22_9BACT|nr:MAG: hypothetical protein UY92_C0004G0059 [Candidatus Magasanikbacteria bacterium GW2011_GWA2_56_11]